MVQLNRVLSAVAEKMRNATISSHFKDIGVVIGAVAGGLTLWKWWQDRPDLKIDVDWEWSENDHDDCSAPRIEIRNLGGRTAYVHKIEVVEANGGRNVIATFDNREIKPDQNFSFRPNWNEPSDDDPQFRHGWEGLRIVVTDARGKEWRSGPPANKPSWFRVSSSLEIDA